MLTKNINLKLNAVRAQVKAGTALFLTLAV
jgi:hypothetical protein